MQVSCQLLWSHANASTYLLESAGDPLCYRQLRRGLQDMANEVGEIKHSISAEHQENTVLDESTARIAIQGGGVLDQRHRVEQISGGGRREKGKKGKRSKSSRERFRKGRRLIYILRGQRFQKSRIRVDASRQAVRPHIPLAAATRTHQLGQPIESIHELDNHHVVNIDIQTPVHSVHRSLIWLNLPVGSVRGNDPQQRLTSRRTGHVRRVGPSSSGNYWPAVTTAVEFVIYRGSVDLRIGGCEGLQFRKDLGSDGGGIAGLQQSAFDIAECVKWTPVGALGFGH